MNQTQKNQNSKQRTFFIISGAIIVVLLALFFLTDNTKSDDTVLSISSTGQAAQVFIDRSRVAPLSAGTSSTSYNISPGQKQVLVAHDGYWPWQDEVNVVEGVTTEIQPFLIERTGKRVLQTTSAVTEALETAAGESVATDDNPVISSDGKVRIFVDEDTNIIAQWTGSTSSAPDYMSCYEGTCGVSVYNQTPIGQIEFYPDRNDVIFFSTATGVYAIEVNAKSATQNFQPVIEGVQNPVFTTADGNIFVLANNGRITVNNI